MSVYFVDEKIHINLSEHCLKVIELDRLSHGIYGDEKSITGFINRIFTNFYGESKANVSYQVSKKKKELEDRLSQKEYSHISDADKNKLINNLLNKYKEELIKENSSYPKFFGKKYRINNENQDIIEDLDEEIEYAGSVGNFIKIILEEYSLLNPSERQRIYYKDIINVIESAITSNRGIRIVQHTTIRKDESDNNITKPETQKFEVKPYKIVANVAKDTLYVLGMARSERGRDKNISFKPRCFRIDMIQRISDTGSFGDFISSTNKIALDEAFNKYGPAMENKVITVQVKFTQLGLERFSRIVHGRPNNFQKLSDDTYEFSCPKEIARNYFWRLMPEVTIITPTELEEEFKYKAKEILDTK